MRWGRRRFWRRPGAVWRALSVGPSLARAFGRCGCGGRFWLARCGGRAVRDAGAAQGALAGFLAERKMLDKLCKSILNWKQGITQAAAGDGLRHRPHRWSCSAHPTSTSSVAAWPPRHLPRIAKGDARSHLRRALPPRAPPRRKYLETIYHSRCKGKASPEGDAKISSEAGLAPSGSPAAQIS